MKRIVIALGGNALGNTPEEQLQLVEHTAETIVKLAKEGYDIMIGHGNGPQVGMINLGFETSHEVDPSIPSMPFPECGAMSQGYIGYHLQQAIGNELYRQGVDRQCASVVTQVVVDKEDPAFANPTKPIGKFMTKEDAERVAAERGYQFVEDAGRGYRRVVPSPLPVRIVEASIVEQLVKQNAIVITVGGGGIPVLETEKGLEGVAAVIDKDRSSAKLATDLSADMLVILTAVEKVYVNFNKPEQRALDTVTIAEMEDYMAQDQFAKGSMLPKVEACIDFVRETGGQAIITSLEKAAEALSGETGTVIVK